MKPKFLATALLLVPLVSRAGVTLTVDTSRTIGTVDEKLYGQFLEHIYHSCNGGLWGDLVWNRSFEEKASRDADPTASSHTPFRHWNSYGGCVVTADCDHALNGDTAAKLHATGGEESGVEQAPFCIRQGETYRGSCWVRGTASGGLVARLLDGPKVLAEIKLPSPTGEWTEIHLEFRPAADADQATLRIGTSGAADFWLDQVSLMPESWRKDGGFRPDLLQAVAALRPAVLRWPGGSYVSTYRWKNGIGPQAERRAAPNAMWDDRDVNSLGTDEYIALCRKIGAKPLIVININHRGGEETRGEYIQEACDWVEYCNGPADSKWGRVRAANGHPEPYRVTWWEIDNEVWQMEPEDYARCVNRFADAMKQVDPSISVIAGGSGQFGKRWNKGDPTVIRDCADKIDYLSVHAYENPDRFNDGLPRAERFITSLGKLIAESKNPKLRLFFSEWNAQSTDWRTGLYAGGILNTFERSGTVTMATPALFLRHVSATKWDNALINFDHKSWFPAPNYVVMKLWRDHYAPNLLATTGDTAPLNLVATRDAARNTCHLKVVNPTNEPVTAKIRFTGPFHPTAATFDVVAPGSPEARNTLENPHTVQPAPAPAAVTGDTLTITLPPLSAGAASVK